MGSMERFYDIHGKSISRVFRAKRKLNMPGLVSHITQRAAGKEPLFLEDADRLYMLGLLKDISHKQSINVYAFCLMGNHVHILLSNQEENLYDAMRDLFSRYAMWFNKKYERKGHLFGGPYRQAVCLDDGYLVTASVYIHLNPVKAGLVSFAEEYRWSSVRLYCEEGAPESFVDPYFILHILDGNSGKGKEMYRGFLSRGAKVETTQVFEQEDVIERFRVQLVSLFPPIFKRMAGGNTAGKAAGLELLSVDSLEERIESLKQGDLKPGPETRSAKKYLVEQLLSRGYKRREIAERLGMSRKTIYNILQTST